MSTAFEQESSRSESVSVAADFDQTFPTGPASRFVLENPRGRIVVRAWERPEIHVHAIRRRGQSNEQYEATRVEWYQQGETVYVRTVLDPSAAMLQRGALSGVAAELMRAFGDLFRWNGKTAEVDYQVDVPVGCELDLKGVSSAISLTGLRAPASLYSVSGAVSVDQHVGLLRLQTVSGEIAARAVDGPAYVESVSGSVRLAGKVASLAAKTVSGEIDVESPLESAATYEAQTVSGSATFIVPAETKATLSLRGVSGDVVSDLPCVVTRDQRGPGSREWQGTLNGGGARVHVQTVSGHLRVREAAPGVVPPAATDATEIAPVAGTAELARPVAELPPTPSSPPAAPEPPAGSADDGDAMKVLQALERGELSVDAALRELDRLRGSSTKSGESHENT
jgi:hypothetical protein